MTNENPGCFSFLTGKSAKPARPLVQDLPVLQIKDTFPYRLRDDFLSPAELSFFHVVKNMMGDHFLVLTKVSLADIFFVTRPNENQSAYNRINRKHVDFLICAPNTVKPLFAIELDDSSHQRADRIERDAFVDAVFEAASLPLLHIPVRMTYNTAELGLLFREALKKSSYAISNAPVELAPTPPATNAGPVVKPAPVAASSARPEAAQPSASPRQATPVCPKCGTPMVLRTVRQGEHTGRQFWGCANYPKCRVMFPLETR